MCCIMGYAGRDLAEETFKDYLLRTASRGPDDARVCRTEFGLLGFGRLGKLTAHRMHALGARVSVAARKWADLAWAEAYGYVPEHIGHLDGYLCPYDLVVNTVPAPVLGAAELGELKKESLVIDLASLPGGVDLGAAERLGVKAVRALSLPGKVAPATAAAALRTAICHILNELGV